jgi:hypothetical protein
MSECYKSLCRPPRNKVKVESTDYVIGIALNVVLQRIASVDELSKSEFRIAAFLCRGIPV